MKKSKRARALAKRGLISDKAMAKMKGAKGQGGDVKDLDKTGPIASGAEGDSPSRMAASGTYR